MRYVYLLRDPISLEIKYVGETMFIKQRFDQHKWGQKDSSNVEKIEWSNNLKKLKLQPLLEIIDFAETKKEALTKENHYICKYLKEGNKLFNRSNNKQVKQFDFDGNLIAIYENCLEAEKLTGTRPRIDRYSAGGFYWTYTEFDKNKLKQKEEALKVRCKVVQQFDLNDNFIAEFEGVRIAGKETGIDHRSISQVAAGSKIRKTAGGFKWKYK
jgi:predicted GIY-YIG superfamily endonuclease